MRAIAVYGLFPGKWAARHPARNHPSQGVTYLVPNANPAFRFLAERNLAKGSRANTRVADDKNFLLAWNLQWSVEHGQSDSGRILGRANKAVVHAVERGFRSVRRRRKVPNFIISGSRILDSWLPALGESTGLWLLSNWIFGGSQAQAGLVCELLCIGQREKGWTAGRQFPAFGKV